MKKYVVSDRTKRCQCSSKSGLRRCVDQLLISLIVSWPRGGAYQRVEAEGTSVAFRLSFTEWRTIRWSSGKCVRLGAGRSNVLSPGSYQDLKKWYCSLLSRRTVCRRAAESTSRIQNKSHSNESRHCTNSVVALQDHYSCWAPSTKHHMNQICWVTA